MGMHKFREPTRLDVWLFGLLKVPTFDLLGMFNSFGSAGICCGFICFYSYGVKEMY